MANKRVLIDALGNQVEADPTKDKPHDHQWHLTCVVDGAVLLQDAGYDAASGKGVVCGPHYVEDYALVYPDAPAPEVEDGLL